MSGVVNNIRIIVFRCNDATQRIQPRRKICSPAAGINDDVMANLFDVSAINLDLQPGNGDVLRVVPLVVIPTTLLVLLMVTLCLLSTYRRRTVSMVALRHISIHISSSVGLWFILEK